MLEICVIYCDVGLVEGRADLATVDAMADMAVEQAGLLKWKYELHGAAEAGGSCFVLSRPAIARKVNNGEALIIK